ncbi:unnamed protein product, partial [Allacma fusca]
MNKMYEMAEQKRLAREAELDQKRLEREAEMEKRRLDMEKFIIDNNGFDSDGDDPAEVNPEVNRPGQDEVVPNISSWLENQPIREIPTSLGESHNLQEQLVLTNHRLEKILSRQTVSKELPIFGG